MMELSHSLTLNETALQQLPEADRPVFVFEWLRFLDKVLVAAQQSDIKDCQKKLVDQLICRLEESPGPPTRKLMARCLATLFSVGDTFLLFDTVNKCNDILKNKDDSPSFLPVRLAAICCIGSMYEKLGRMMGRSYEETVSLLIRSLKGAESQTRIEIMNTLEKVCAGMGNAIQNMHKEVYKACRQCLVDRVTAVRCAAASCLLELLEHSPLLHTVELESLATLCFRAFDGSNYEARCAVAKLLAALVATTQQNQKKTVYGPQSKTTKTISLEEALNILMPGFLRGSSGFLKGTGEIIKGSSSINREVRLGVTHSYVMFVQILGGVWLESNMVTFLTHVLDLVACPKTASSHVDAVYSRRCVSFILRNVLGKMLGEKAQTSACKEILNIIISQMKSIEFNPETTKDCNQESLFSQHLLVCALQELGSLILGLGTSVQNLINDTSLNILEGILSVLIHPCYAARLAAAWCLRCVCLAVPNEITSLIVRCSNNLDKMRTAPEAVSGYSAALAAVIGSVRSSPLGVPHTKGKELFNTAEELLRSASQNSRLSLSRTQAGWLLIGSIMTLGVSVVRGLLPRMLLLWRNSFPRSSKELESEKARGDAFTWQVSLEGRAGALSSIHSLLLNCPEVVTEDMLHRLMLPIDCALAMLVKISPILKTYGQVLKAPVAMVRLRLYEILLLLPPQSFEGSYTHLLRMIVAEFTLTENYANTTTSLLRSLCHVDDSIILETWLQETGHYAIEDQLHCNSGAGLGALEHDYCCLYRQLPAEETVPGPLPLGVTVIDSSIQLFGQIFPRVANKHKLQMLDHFCECIKHSKSSRQEAIQMNVFAALLSGLRCVMEAKTTLGMEDVRKSAAVLITGALTSPNPILKCASAESLGRLAQVVKDVRFTAEMVQISCDRLKTARDVASRTGYSLALGCLHRYIGGMGANQHLSMSVSILLALARETPSPIVQVWSLQALALIAYSGGPMFRSYVERTLSLMLILLLNVPQSHISVYQCIGKVLASLITTIGPELQQGTTNSVCMVRSSFLCACSIMQEHGDPLVQAEATGCLQQLHLFAPKHVNLSSLVLVLCRNLSSNHLLLRKAAMSCLRQLAHREADEVCDHAMTLAKENHDTNTVEGLVISETGLPGVLFAMLDTESDIRLINDIHETLTSMLQSLVEGNLSQWLGICKDVLTESTLSDEGGTSTLNNDTEVDDQTDLGIGEKSDSSHKSIQPRWPTRVFATQCVRKIIDVCSSSTESAVHFDLCAAKDIQAKTGKGDYLVCHLSDLVRIAFIAATSDSDPLRLEGLKLLQEVIEKFARVPEPEFPGHLLLEQSQAQVGAALRPAFSKGTPSHVTATACDVCSTWMGSGVARDLTDLRRVHQLLDSSLSKFESKTNDVKLYNESLSTLEKLAILKAWGEVYIIAMVDNKLTDEGNINEEELKKCESLLTLVQPQLLSLSKYWNAALRDYALLSLPPEFSSQLPRDRGAFYTTDTADCSKPHYFSYWSPILHAAALWLSTQADEIEEPTTPTEPNVEQRNDNEYIPNTYSDQFYLLFGICMQALGSQQWSERSDHIIKCLHGLSALLDTVRGRQLLTAAAPYPVELCCVLHRLQITHDTPAIQMLSIQVVKKVVMAAREHLDILRKQSDESEFLGEGGTDGELNPQKSVVVSVLNICVCILIRFFPVIHTPMSNSLGFVCSQSLSRSPIADKVLVSVINTLECLLSLCSPYGALEIAPIILHLTTEVIKEFNSKPTPPVQAALQCFTTVVKHEYCRNKHSEQKWKTLLKSTLIKIIDLSKMSNDDKCLNEATVMSIISIFVLNAPPEVICSPSLKYPCINHLRQCFQSENLAVKHKAVQIISSIFQHQDQTVTRPYIQALAPQLIDYLHSENGNRLSCNIQLTVTLEVIAAIEALVGLTEQQYRSELLSVLILVLINYLLDGQAMLAADKLTIALHEYSLKWLNKVGPKYPQEFKEIIGQSTYMRTRLESAIHNNQNTQVKNKQKPTKTKPTLSQVQPSIKLKTDFSNFS